MKTKIEILKSKNAEIQSLIKKLDWRHPATSNNVDLSSLIEAIEAELSALVAVAEAAKLEHLALCKLIEYIETPANKRINLDVRDVLYPARECRFNSSEAIANLAAVREGNGGAIVKTIHTVKPLPPVLPEPEKPFKVETAQDATAARWRSLVQIQKGHLELWQKLLKPEVFDKLKQRISDLTPTYAEFVSAVNEPDVPRGVDIRNELFNYVEPRL